MVAHVKKFHSEAAKRKAEEDAEIFRLELLHANKVPRLGYEEQTGGAVTRGMKRSGDNEETNPDVKRVKNDWRNPKDPGPRMWIMKSRCFKLT